MTTEFSYKNWYERNGAVLNGTRKARYQTDPAYRARVLEMNQKSREKKRAEATVEEKAERRATMVQPVASPWKEMLIEVEDTAGVRSTQQVLTIGALAKVLGKSIKSIRLWEKKGWIPPAPYRSLKGDRLYPPELVLELHKKLSKEGRTSDTGQQTRPRTHVHKVTLSTGETWEGTLFPVGDLAKACERNISTMEQMEAKGYFPKTPLRAPASGYRLYTAKMIEVAREVLLASRVKLNAQVDWPAIHSTIKTAWDLLGMDDTARINS